MEELKDLINNQVIYYAWRNGEYFVCINYSCFKDKFKPVFTIKFKSVEQAEEFKLKKCVPNGYIKLKHNILEFTCDEFYFPQFISCGKDIDLAIKLKQILKEQLHNQVYNITKKGHNTLLGN